MATLDPNAQGLSMPNARVLGQAANMAYQNADACRKWATDNGFNEAFDFFSKTGELTDTNGFIAQNAQAVVVAFRGTDPKRAVDWFIDLNALQQHAQFPGAKVHKGFEDALTSVWGPSGADILPQRLAARGNRTVWITGHSLGGALAELAAAKSALVSGIPVKGVYTFGQPRVGDEGFARKMEEAVGSEVFRFINNHDIVPRVPLWGMGYRHYAGQLFFKGMAMENQPITIENLFAAIRLAALGVDLDLAKEVVDLGAALLTHNDAVANRELQLLGNPKADLAAGTANIADHSMVNGYLPRLGA